MPWRQKGPVYEPRSSLPAAFFFSFPHPESLVVSPRRLCRSFCSSTLVYTLAAIHLNRFWSTRECSLQSVEQVAGSTKDLVAEVSELDESYLHCFTLKLTVVLIISCPQLDLYIPLKPLSSLYRSNFIQVFHLHTQLSKIYIIMFGSSSTLALSALFSLAAVQLVRADPTPTEPAPGDVMTEGETCNVTWDTDSTGTWTSMDIELMTGSNEDMVHLTSMPFRIHASNEIYSLADHPCSRRYC